jgi:hypothetical protein
MFGGWSSCVGRDLGRHPRGAGGPIPPFSPRHPRCMAGGAMAPVGVTILRHHPSLITGSSRRRPGSMQGAAHRLDVRGAPRTWILAFAGMTRWGEMEIIHHRTPRPALGPPSPQRGEGTERLAALAPRASGDFDAVPQARQSPPRGVTILRHHPSLTTGSSRRRPGSMRGAAHRLDVCGEPRTWIPACAGMTRWGR